MSKRKEQYRDKESKPRGLFSIDDDVLSVKEAEVAEKIMDVNFDISSQIIRIIVEAVKACPKSRAVIAAEMSDLITACISEHMINAWTSKEKEHYRFPLEYAPAFCYVTSDFKLIRLAAEVLGLQVLDDKQVLWLELAKVRDIEKRAKAQRKIIEKRIGAKPL